MYFISLSRYIIRYYDVGTYNIIIYNTGRGRLADAEKSLCWLRGWVKPESVQYELSMLNKSIALNEEKIKMKKNKKFYSFYVKRTFLLPYFIITAAFFFGNFGGMITLQINAVSILIISHYLDNCCYIIIFVYFSNLFDFCTEWFIFIMFYLNNLRVR